MVCDADRALAVGGVMGGADSEVTGRTTSVLLEAAYWDPAGIRRTSRALGLHTDAAYRFERGGDIDGLRSALDRAAQLMADLGGGVIARGVLDVYPEPRPRPRIVLRLARVERVIGVCPPRAEVVGILQRLGFAVGDSGTDLEVVVPSFRRDIAQEDDLVEEIIRVWGYDKIPVTLARGGELRPVTRPRGLTVSRAVSRALNAAGLAECVTYAFVDPDRLRAMGWGDDAALVTLQNPLSRERSVLRPSLMAGLLDVLALNANRGNPDARVFEIGHIFAPRRAEDVDRPVHEELWAGIALTGLRERRSWSASRDRADVFDAKGLGELVLAAAGAPGSSIDALGRGHGAALSRRGPRRRARRRWPRGGLVRRARARRARRVRFARARLRGRAVADRARRPARGGAALPAVAALSRGAAGPRHRGARGGAGRRRRGASGSGRCRCRSSRGSCSSTSTRATRSARGGGASPSASPTRRPTAR